MAEIDRLMMERFGVNTYQLMELAGYAVADAVRRRKDSKLSARILALAGTGGNGGDAMVAARLLAGWGHRSTVILSRPRAHYSGIAAHQLNSLDALGISVLEPTDVESLPDTDLIIDGLLGFRLRGNPTGEAARLISLANASSSPVVAIDVPSGLNADTGAVGDPCVHANQTVTLALPKTGLIAADTSVTGEVVVGDIGLPSEVYGLIGVEVDPGIFATDNLVRVR